MKEAQGISQECQSWQRLCHFSPSYTSAVIKTDRLREGGYLTACPLYLGEKLRAGKTVVLFPEELLGAYINKQVS